MRWQQGRRGTGYETLRFFSGMLGRFGLDAYLIRYPPGVGIPRHTDPVRNAKDYRCNLTLIQPRHGGDVHLWAHEAATALGRAFTGYPPWKYTVKGIPFIRACFLRNKDIVDNSDEVVAVYPGDEPTGGTADTIRLTLAAGKPLRRVQ